MKIKNMLATQLELDLPTGALRLAGKEVSRDLTPAEANSHDVQKALSRKWARVAAN